MFTNIYIKERLTMAKRKKYKIISEDLQKNLIEFLDEVQFDAAKSKTTENMHIVNFCSWAINELLNGYDAYLSASKYKLDKKNPKKKSRDEYLEETFMDWNLPDMSDEEYEKLVDTFDSFLRSWEKEYNKKNPKKKVKREPRKRISFEDIAQHCSLDEIEDMLLDDHELTKKEKFDLYYTEHKRVEKENEPKYTLDEICKKLKLDLPPDEEKN